MGFAGKSLYAITCKTYTPKCLKRTRENDMNYQDITIGDLERLRDAKIGDVVDTAAGKVRVEKMKGAYYDDCMRICLFSKCTPCKYLLGCEYHHKIFTHED
jgi:hypothetical protein